MTASTAPQVGSRLQTGSWTVHEGVGGADSRGQSYDVPTLFDEAFHLFQAGQLSEAEKIFGERWKYKLSISTPCTCWVLC